MHSSVQEPVTGMSIVDVGSMVPPVYSVPARIVSLFIRIQSQMYIIEFCKKYVKNVPSPLQRLWSWRFFPSTYRPAIVMEIESVPVRSQPIGNPRRKDGRGKRFYSIEKPVPITAWQPYCFLSGPAIRGRHKNAE